MEFSTEPVPTWALCYLINDDRSGLTDEETAMIDKWYTDNKVTSVTTANEDVGQCYPYFSRYPVFGLPTEVIDCSVMMIA